MRARSARALAAAGIRYELDLGSDKIGYKVREHSLAKVPRIVAVGAREAELGTVSVRRLGEQKQETLALDEAVALFVGNRDRRISRDGRPAMARHDPGRQEGVAQTTGGR